MSRKAPTHFQMKKIIMMTRFVSIVYVIINTKSENGQKRR